MVNEILLNWRGPYRFVEGNAADLPPDEPGVYVFAVAVAGEYLVHYVGEAGAMVTRWSDHLCQQLGGRYKVFDPNLLRKGESLILYNDEGGATNMVAFSGSLAQTAYEYARTTLLFCASFPSKSPLRKSVESGIIESVRRSGHAGRLLSNKGVSRSPDTAPRVVCTSSWPAGMLWRGSLTSLSTANVNKCERKIPGTGATQDVQSERNSRNVHFGRALPMSGVAKRI